MKYDPNKSYDVMFVRCVKKRRPEPDRVNLFSPISAIRTRVD